MTFLLCTTGDISTWLQHEFDPITNIKMMSPAALLVIAAKNDSVIPITAIKAAYKKAAEPKHPSVHPVGHFDFYRYLGLSTTATEGIAWFNQHLA